MNTREYPKIYRCTCKICGKQFMAAAPNATLCSKSCRTRSQVLYNRVWRTNPEAKAQRALKTYLKQRLKILKELCIPYPEDIMDREFTSEIQIDNAIRSLIEQ